MKTLGALLLVCAAGVLLAQSKKGGGDEAALKAIEEKWEAANVKADVAAIGAILADTFVSTTAEGHVRSRQDVLNEVKSGEIKYETSKLDDLKVSVYGNAAVVTGRWSGKVVEKGAASEAAERFTDTFIRQHGQWRCVASHSSPIH